MLPAPYFGSLGLSPLSWDDALRVAEATLGEEAETFARRHRAFVAYPTEHTARAFYDLAARHGLHGLLASHRFDRLVAIAESLAATPGRQPLRDTHALDVGAGGGFLARWLRDVHGARVTVSDLSPASEDALAAQGFARLRDAAPEARFDLVLCADSLGEVNADEDEWLSDAANASDPRFAEELEARYGLGHKLAALRPRLAPGGVVALFEPAAQAHFWRGAAGLLEQEGWIVEIRGPRPTWGLWLSQGPVSRDVTA